MSVRSLSSTAANCWARGRRCSHLRPQCWYIRCHSTVHQREGQGASTKLSEDAAREEAGAEIHASEVQGGRRKLSRTEHHHENWSGEESVQDAVLRMLVDKYKPLRTGIIRTADEKLKDAPPPITSETTYPGVHTWKEMANEPLLPAVEGHKPWHTTFKAPSHASASVKFGNIELPSTRSVSAPTDERTKRTERESLKRKEQVSRLTRARESTLDYRLGLRDGGDRRPARVNPVTLKGWQGLVEDRIEVGKSCIALLVTKICGSMPQKARMAGAFDKVSGRGQPIARVSEERNPFIAREEFLMNRIVQRNGATSPWVEVQIELESAVNSFRETLRQSWTRRAVRMLTVSQSAATLPDLSLATVTTMRDREWENRECSYHNTAIAELNSLVRKYNAMAPYAVRRPYYVREVELERAYADCREEILRAMREKKEKTSGYPVSISKAKPVPSVDGPVDPGSSFWLPALILQWVERLWRKFTGPGQP
ncbi:hypothetical protein EDD16DRAFT_1700785 [Pisolithus croceorrhizus]|nr:hypothetical protein EDD16DRAFT_1700785 [Pisolithus croceorrhizus]KAI6135104.1 hypothetical protein EV401DRAFT_2063419 [Pisolithus croceorrhizus]KAI6163187.1 hypothetical protein EDD17DRAFT_1756692 [Pisolithus thermaeus]